MSQINSKWSRIQKWLLLTRLIYYESTCSWKSPEWQFSLCIPWNTDWMQTTSAHSECRQQFRHGWINCTVIKEFFPTLPQLNIVPILVLLTLITYIVLVWCKTLILSFHDFVHTHIYTHTVIVNHSLQCFSTKSFRCVTAQETGNLKQY